MLDITPFLPSSVCLYVHYRSSLCSQNLGQTPRQRQVPRRTSHVYGLRVGGDDPVLRRRVPVRDVTAGDVGAEGGGLVRLDGKTLEVSENDLRIVGATEGDVLYKIRSCAWGLGFIWTALTTCGTSSPVTEPVLEMVALTWYRTSYSTAFPPGAPPAAGIG